MRRVLFVAYFFPPLGGAGVQRSLKFVKYLPSLGWLPDVVTVGDSDYPRKDPSLLAEVPAEVTIHRTGFRDVWKPWAWLPKTPLAWRLSRFVHAGVCFPDEWAGWIPHAVRECLEVVERVRPEVLYTTSSPVSSHLIGLAVKKSTGIPWVADFRDEWTTNPFINLGVLARHRHRRAEREVLSTADAVTSVTPGITANLTALAGRSNARFVTIPNGYDEEDFVAPLPDPVPGRFTIAYSGLFYGDRQPDTFLAGLELAIAREPDLATAARFVVAGDSLNNPHIARFPHPALIEQLGYVDHARAVQVVRSADLALLINPRQGADYLPGKLLEYLASGCTILALAPPQGVAADIVRDANAGVVVDPDDVAGTANAIATEYRRWKEGARRPARNEAYIARFSRRHTASELAQLFEAISSA